MIGRRPNFIDSPYLVMDKGDWHLKEGAPPEVVKEFNEFMKASNKDGFVPTLRIKSKRKK